MLPTKATGRVHAHIGSRVAYPELPIIAHHEPTIGQPLASPVAALLDTTHQLQLTPLKCLSELPINSPNTPKHRLPFVHNPMHIHLSNPISYVIVDRIAAGAKRSL
jgi:hypothetical protein